MRPDEASRVSVAATYEAHAQRRATELTFEETIVAAAAVALMLDSLPGSNNHVPALRSAREKLRLQSLGLAR